MKTRFLPAVAATVITAGVLAVPSIAQESSTDDTTVESTESDERPDFEEKRAEIQERRAEMRARHDELLAGELDVTVEELQAAQENVRATLKAERRVELEASLAEKVEAGDLTQQEADEILEAFDNGERIGPRGEGGRRGHGPHGPHGPRGDDAGGSVEADGTAA